MTIKQPSSSSPSTSSAHLQAAAAAPKGSSSSSSTTIRSFHLKGHLGSVLCLDYNHDSNLLVSGSEDQTARLWDLRTDASSSSSTDSRPPLRASLCIQCPSEVNSVVFGPLPAREITAAPSSSSASSLFGRDCCVFLAVENSVHGYDLRNATSPVIQWNDKSSIRRVMPLSSTDEINQIIFSQQKRKQSIQLHQQQQQPPLFLLAAADDAGEIRVTNHYWMSQEQQRPPQPAILQHSAPGAMITACAFRPNHQHHHQNQSHHAKKQRNTKHKKKNQQHQQHRQRQDELQHQSQSCPVGCATELLATGGTDCAIQLWDVSSNPHQQHRQQDGKDLNNVNNPQQQQPPPIRHRPLEQHTMQSLQSGANQVCNPPMVHSLDWSPTGRILAAGLGDGSVALFTTISCHNTHKKSTLLQVARLEDAHGGAVASVHFPCTNNSNSASLVGASPDRLLLTAGNDGVVVAWDLGATLCESSQQERSNSIKNKDNRRHGDKHDETHDNVVDNDDDALSHWMRLLQLGECGNETSSNKKLVDDDSKNNKDNDEDFNDDYDFDDCEQPKTLFGIQHGIKPNWMVTNYNSSTPCNIFVADTSNDITGYCVHSL